MRKNNLSIERWRVKFPQSHDYYSEASDGNNGLFLVKYAGVTLKIIASDKEGWDHVSVSLRTRNPTWGEMAFVKEMFWEAEECVMQLHPPKSVHVDIHPHCLHLWRPQGSVIPMPPMNFV